MSISAGIDGVRLPIERGEALYVALCLAALGGASCVLLFLTFSAVPGSIETKAPALVFFIGAWAFVARYLCVIGPAALGGGGMTVSRNRLVFGSPVFFSAGWSDIDGVELVTLRRWSRDLPYIRVHLSGKRSRDLPAFMLRGDAQRAFELVNSERSRRAE